MGSRTCLLAAAALLSLACGADEQASSAGVIRHGQSSLLARGGDESAAARAPWAGPYGTSVGDTLDPDLCWSGYAKGASNPGRICARDYYDPDGTKRIRALLIDLSAVWCGVCRNEAQGLPDRMSGPWSGKEVAVVNVLYEDASHRPATAADALAWRKRYTRPPNGDWAVGYGTGLPVLRAPTNYVVDPRTMKICLVADGDGSQLDQRIVALADDDDCSP